jgi:outer membrane protein OmpA-like peptidoglycan-associated protein/Tol biopolymer transport system component
MKKYLGLVIALFFCGSVLAQVIPGNYDKNIKKGKEHFALEEYRQALPYFVEAWKVDTMDYKLAFNIATCYFKIKQELQAFPYLDNAKVGIKDPILTFYYARVFHLQHKFEAAIKLYREYQQTLDSEDPEYFEMHQYIANCKYGIELIKKPLKVKITNLGPVINSPYPDYVPVISADETELLFTSRRPTTTGGGRDEDGLFYEDIYQSNKLNDTTWSEPEDIGNGINTDSHDACVALSPDGMELIMYRHSGTDGGDLYVSMLKGVVWDKPKKLGNAINTPYWEPSASVSADEKTIFFTSNRKGGLGGTDIYMTRMKDNGDFGAAILLGPAINTPLDEDAPFIHADGKTLYFSSKGHKSMGGYDIFYCTIDLETGEILTPPQNIGYPINTADDDVFFVWSADGRRAYFSSIRDGGYGDKDIYVLEREAVKKAPTVLFKGQIVACEDKRPVTATIFVTDLATQKIVGVFNSNSFTGKYTVSLPAGKNYAISVEASGYLFESKNINFPLEDGYIELVDTICMNKLKMNTSIILRNVFFDVDKSTLRPESVQELDKLTDIMRNNPNLKIELSGHTDSDGDDKHNMILSDNRAKAVVDYLIAKGINPNRLTWKGYGETAPIEPNDTPEHKQQNRRTEVKILSNG